MTRLANLSPSSSVEEVVNEDGSSLLRVRFARPLGAGLRTIPIPRNLAEFLVAKRHVVELSPARGLARHLVRAAFTTLERFPRFQTQVYLSDAELVTAKGRFDDGEIVELARIVDAIASAIGAEVERQPPAAWKQTVRAAWSPLVEELGARFDPDELELVLRRGQRQISVRVSVDDHDTWLTCVRVGLDEPSSSSASDIDPSHASEGLRAWIVGSELVLSRSGIVADARYLSRMIDIAFDMAADSSRRRGPYRT